MGRRLFRTLVACSIWAGLLGVPLRGEEQAPERQGEAIIVRAIGSYSPGFTDILKKVEAKGFQTRIYIPSSAIKAADQIVEDRRAGRTGGPLVIFGYSLGADASLTLSRKLGERGLSVDRQVLVEPTIPPTVPANVRYCFNLYVSRPHRDFVPALRGVAVHRDSPATQLVNYDIRQYQPSQAWKTKHLTILTDAYWRSVLVSQMVDNAEDDTRPSDIEETVGGERDVDE